MTTQPKTEQQKRLQFLVDNANRTKIGNIGNMLYLSKTSSQKVIDKAIADPGVRSRQTNIQKVRTAQQRLRDKLDKRLLSH